MITITINDDFGLTYDSNIIPAQHSANIPFKLELPEKYQGALVVPGYIYYDGIKKIESAVDNYNNGDFSIPSDGFSKEGMLGISFSLTVGDVTETTTIAEFEVRGSVNTSFSLPDKEIWQSMLQNFMNQYMDKVYSSVIQELIDKDAKLQQDTEDLQETVNDLVDGVNQKLENGDFVPNIAIEAETVGSDVEAEVVKSGTNIEPIFTFKIPKGEKGDAGPTGPQGETGPMGPQGPAGEGGGQSYMPPLNLNADFQVSQRAENPYIGKSSPHMTLDAWELYTPGANPQQVYIEPFLEGGIRLSSYRVGENATISQTLYFISDYTANKYELTAHVYIESMSTNVTFTHDDEVTNLKQGLNLIEFTASSSSKYIFIDLIGTGDVVIKYCAIYPSSYAGNHHKEDKDIALMRCQQYLVCLKNRTAGNGYRFLGMVKKTSATAGDFFIPLPTKMVGTPTISMKSVVIRGSTTITSFKNINEMGNGISGTVETVSGDSSIMSFIMIDSSDGYLDISCE